MLILHLTTHKTNKHNGGYIYKVKYVAKV